MADYKDIAGRIRTTASDGVSVEAQEILDISKNKKQSQINAETDTTLANHASAIQGLNSQNYGTYTATDQTTAETDVLPAEGSEDTIYRLGNWDGTQYDVTCYSEYSWNGSAYVHISTKPQIGEVFDISAYHASGGTLATYSDLNDALNGTNGGIPQSLQKGGMSVKFVHTSDNKYVRCNLLTDSFTTDTTQWAIGDDGVYVENQEYIYIKTDYQDRILWAIKADGSIYYGAGVPQQVIDYIEEKVEELNGDITAIQDFLAGITEETLLGYLNKTYGEYSESPEWINVETDSGGKILNGIKKDGSHYAYNLHSETIDKNANDIANLNNTKVEKVEGKGLSSNDYTDSDKEIVKCDSIIEDREDRIVIETDSDDKILSYRDKDGILHENVGIDSDSVNTNHLNLSEEGMEEFQQALIGAGFNPKMPIDWSDSKELHLPIPRTCAKINLIVTSLPTTKTDDCEGYVEYIDFDGNYFKKKMVLNAQGESSMHFLEKNFTLDIDDKSKIQFGNWVFQDSFHLKAYYIDVFRGVNNICYKYTNKVIEYLNCRANRVLNNPVNVTNTDGTGTFNIDFGSSAMCQPDGFPVEIYHNGEYYGLYAINLKKHRDNYQMSKNNYQQALLDGLLSWDTIWDGTIDWTQFELRNPKTLILEDGITEYDGDNPSEIIGINSPNYDSTNINHVNTATTKAMIQEVASCLADVYNMPITTPQEIADAKAAFEAHYDVKMLKCYFILSNVLYHRDGFAKNWIWAIYDGMASPTFYDMDTVFGRHWTGGMMYNSSTTEIFGLESTDTVSPSTVLASLYKDELDLMYKELRDKGLISVSHIMKYIQDWIDCQTREAIQRNLKKWTAIPSYRADGGSYPPPLSYDVAHQSDGMYDCPARVEKWLTARLVTLDIYFNYNQN